MLCGARAAPDLEALELMNSLIGCIEISLNQW